jgi:hypothetical protein
MATAMKLGAFSVDLEPVVIDARQLRATFHHYPEVTSQPRTREQPQKALTHTSAWLDNLDATAPASADPAGSQVHAVAEMSGAVAAHDLIMADQVAKTRANGRSWTQIAAAHGVTTQAA